MTAKNDIQAIKDEDNLPDAERVWKAIEKLAEHIDNASRTTGNDIRGAFRAS